MSDIELIRRDGVFWEKSLWERESGRRAVDRERGYYNRYLRALLCWCNTRNARLVFAACLAAILIFANTYGAIGVFIGLALLIWACKPFYQLFADEAGNV